MPTAHGATCQRRRTRRAPPSMVEAPRPYEQGTVPSPFHRRETEGQLGPVCRVTHFLNAAFPQSGRCPLRRVPVTSSKAWVPPGFALPRWMTWAGRFSSLSLGYMADSPSPHLLGKWDPSRATTPCLPRYRVAWGELWPLVAVPLWVMPRAYLLFSWGHILLFPSGMGAVYNGA